MLLTKVLFVFVIIDGVLNIMNWERNNYKKFNYFVMWIICVLQILTRIVEG